MRAIILQKRIIIFQNERLETSRDQCHRISF